MDKLLEILSENSGFSNKELALMLGEPEDKIASRIKDYEQEGIIKGYQAIVDSSKLPDAGVTAIIELKVTPKKETGFEDTARQIMKFEEVSSLYLMAGSFDFTVMVKGKSMQDVASFVAKRISCVEGVTATATHFLLKEYKKSGLLLADDSEPSDGRSMVL